MVAVIRKASDWKFEKVEEHFSMTHASFERLAKEFNDHVFIVDIRPFDEDYDVEITVYDDYIE